MTTPPAPARRADAARNARSLLDAAADAFVAGGVDAPVRDIAARAGVGVGTVYRHYPTRADLVIAVYRHQVEALAGAGLPLRDGESPYAALRRWIDGFVDFLVTKHGLASAWQGDAAGFDGLHTYFIDRLLPVLEALLGAAVEAGKAVPGVDPLGLMRAVGNLCIGAGSHPRYDARAMVDLLVAGLRPDHSA